MHRKKCKREKECREKEEDGNTKVECQGRK